MTKTDMEIISLLGGGVIQKVAGCVAFQHL
jgi:hypothetical protein